MAKPFDFADLENWEEVERALHGDLRPIVALLRSDKPISRIARDYIAEEIEREPGKRFRRQRDTDLGVRESDKKLLYAVYWAKVEIAFNKHGADADGDQSFGTIDGISDREALDYLSEQREIEIDEISLNNALRRTPPQLFDPRGRKRQMRSRRCGPQKQ